MEVTHMKRLLILAALLPLLNPISANALQTEITTQLVSRTDERRAWTAHVTRVQERLRERTAARLEAREEWGYPEEATAEIPVPLGNIPRLIYSIFGAAGAKAVSVASCESGL